MGLGPFAVCYTCWGVAGHTPPGLKARELRMNYLSAAAVTLDGKLVFWGDRRDSKDVAPDATILF